MEEVSVLKAIKSKRTLLSHAPRFLKKCCFSELSKNSPACHSGKSNMFIKISTEHWQSDKPRQNRHARIKACPNGTISAANLTWTDLGLNPDLRGQRPVSNRL